MSATKLTFSQVLEARYLREKRGWSVAAIAKRFGVASQYMGMIVRGETRQSPAPGELVNFDPAKLEQELGTASPAPARSAGPSVQEQPAPVPVAAAPPEEPLTPMGYKRSELELLEQRRQARERRWRLAEEVAARVELAIRQEEEEELDRWLSEVPLRPVAPQPPRVAPPPPVLETACARRVPWEDLALLRSANSYIGWAAREHEQARERQIIVSHLFLVVPPGDQDGPVMRRSIVETCKMFSVDCSDLPLEGRK